MLKEDENRRKKKKENAMIVEFCHDEAQITSVRRNHKKDPCTSIGICIN